MSDYISRDVAIIEFMDNDLDHIQAPNGKEAVQILSDIPAADVIEVKHGKWIENSIPDSMLKMCSNCDFTCGAYSFNYCPNCGAKMGKEGEHDWHRFTSQTRS